MSAVPRHLLVTNDFPPKVGGIQSYLWELWRRLPGEQVSVLTTPHASSSPFDGAADATIVRDRQRVLVPTPGLRRRIDHLAAESGSDLVVLDPALPVGLVGPRLHLPYAVVVHGAEITVPGRVPGGSALLSRVLRNARLVVAAGGYPLAESERAVGRPLPSVVVPPGVDVERFVPREPAAAGETRRRFGLPPGRLVLGVSRLVPRKGFDRLIEAVARLSRDRDDLHLAIGGTGRDRSRLERLATRLRAPVTFLGRVPDDDLPALYAAADVFAMLCRNRWGGLEQEGFGIVYLEAAAAGVPALAGRSGGAAEAVAHEQTGLVVNDPDHVSSVAGSLARLLDDDDLRRRLGEAARQRAVESFSYDHLAGVLGEALAGAAA